MIHLPVAAIIAPLFFSFSAIFMKLVSIKLQRGAIFFFALVHPFIILLMYRGLQAKDTLHYAPGEWGAGLGIVLVVDRLSWFFGLLISVGFLLIILYTAASEELKDSKFYVLLFMMLAGMMGIVFTGDLFNMYIFVEVAALASVALVGLSGDNGPLAGMRYVLLTIFSGALMLLSLIVLYGFFGTLSIEQLASSIDKLNNPMIITVYGLFFVSLGMKVGIIPLHMWLVWAYEGARTPVTALLAAIFHKSSIYMAARLFFTLTPAASHIPETILLYTGAITIPIGHLLALGQKNVKKTLAYSSIAHTGYIFVGFGLGTVAGIAAGIFHALNHSIMKITAFLSLDSLSENDRFERDKLRSLGLTRLVAGVTFLVSTINLIGLPPFGSFYSKWGMTLNAVEMGQVLAAAMIPIGTILAALYYGPINTEIFSRGKIVENNGRATYTSQIVLILGAVGCVLPFILAGQINEFLKIIAHSLIN